MQTLATTRTRRLTNENPERPQQQQQQQPQTTDELIANLLTHHKIPSLDAGQMAGLSHYLFTAASPSIRIAVAEVAYLHDHNHPNALDIFLCCALPLAESYARRRAYRIFVRPSDWQLEAMYDGAVEAAIALFQRRSTLYAPDHAFRRYLVRALVYGALQGYFSREENSAVRAVADLSQIPLRTLPKRHPAEQEIITRELLDQVTALPQLTPEAAATLRCIRTLGPDVALKEHAPDAKRGDVEKRKRNRELRPILNTARIAEAMGTTRTVVNQRIWKARATLRDAFDQDGKLFLTRSTYPPRQPSFRWLARFFCPQPTTQGESP